MRKVTEAKYPSSARLFSFCKSVLDAKFGHVRVIDQDVGQILGLDPADCSHWKKGRKHIRSIDSMRAIANHLGIDERLVMDVASGEMSDAEALIEYRGLGHMEVNSAVPDAVRKDWQRRSGQAWTGEMESRLKSFFSVNEPALNQRIEEIHAQIHFAEAPLFIPEITKSFSALKVSAIQSGDQSPLAAQDIEPIGRRLADGTFEVRCVEGLENRPVTRFHTVKAMAPFFISDLLEPAHSAFKDQEHYMRDVYSSVFASRLLVPAKLVRAEMARVDLGRDIVAQLAEVFWVSRSLMNRRLRDILSGSQY